MRGLWFSPQFLNLQNNFVELWKFNLKMGGCELTWELVLGVVDKLNFCASFIV